MKSGLKSPAGSTSYLLSVLKRLLRHKRITRDEWDEIVATHFKLAMQEDG